MIVGSIDSSSGTPATSAVVLVASTKFRGGDAVTDATDGRSTDSSVSIPVISAVVLVASTKFRGGGDVVDTQAKTKTSNRIDSETG